jgi:release factor glutamine methyltransferase
MAMTRLVGAALADATDALRTAGSPTPRLDAEVLLAHAIARDRSWILAHPEAPLDAPEFTAAVERRAAGEPVAYIRGFKEWHSLRILTDARALIPRPETELLADAAIAEIETRLAGAGSVVAWEVATGSGAVAVALATHFRQALADDRLILIASDLSAEALDLAAENLAAHRVDLLVRLLRADLLGPAGGGRPQPEVVIANLPYVASAEVDERKGSLGFEPRIALDGGPDGVVVLRRLLEQLPQRAAAGATVLLEIGVGQAREIGELAPPDASVSVVPDLAGLDRVLRVQLP